MPITIPDNLPSRWMLESEGVFVMDHGSAEKQGLRALRIALIQPHADAHGAQRLAALVANSPLQVELTLVILGPLPSGGTAAPRGAVIGLDAIAQRSFDGLIVTHAAFDQLDWHDVPCWDEYRDLLDWSEERIRARLFIGWSAQGALHHVYGLNRRPLERPVRGLHPCRMVRKNSFLMRGFDERFTVAMDCAALIDAEDVQQSPGLRVLAASDQVGAYLIRNANRRDVFVLGQPGGPAASTHRLALPGAEDVPQPVDAARGHAGRSQAHDSLLIQNWLNFYVYQPFSNQLDASVSDPRPAAPALTR